MLIQTNSPVEDDLGKIKWYAQKLKELRDENSTVSVK